MSCVTSTTVELSDLTIFISSVGYAQEIDTSIIQSLSSDQIAVAKEILGNDNQEASSEIKDFSESAEQSLKTNEIDEMSYTGSTKFGYDYISTSPTSIIATGDLPFPNDYTISIGDISL